MADQLVQNGQPLDERAPASVPPSVAAPSPSVGQNQLINVKSPYTDEIGTIPVAQLEAAQQEGYEVMDDAAVHAFEREQKYGTTGQQLLTAAEGAADAATFGAASALPRLLNYSARDALARREENPISRGAGQVAGLVASSLLLPGGGAAGALESAGAGAARALGLGLEGAGVASKIGSAAVRNGIETAILTGQDEFAKALLNDPNQTVSDAIINVGLGGIIGGALGGAGSGLYHGAVGTISPIWKAAESTKVGSALKSIIDKGSGLETLPDDVTAALNKSGLSISPEMRASLSDDPVVRNMFQTLQESGTKSGLAAQESFKKFRTDLSDHLVKTLGFEPAKVTEEVSKYAHGKAIGETLAKEYSEKLEPIAKEFETLKEKYKNADLIPDLQKPSQVDMSNPYKPVTVAGEVIKGTKGKIADDVGALVMKEGWQDSPEIMREVKRTLAALKNKTNLDDLNKLQTSIGNNTASTLPFGQQTPLSRAGAMLKGILRDASDDVALTKLGEMGPELVDRFAAARQAYKGIAEIRDAINDRLKVGGSTSGFAKGLKEMSATDGEALLRRLSGNNDANVLEFLSKNFPETAEKLKQYHMADLLEKAARKAPEGQSINPGQLFKSIESMAPEMRNFLMDKARQEQLAAIAHVMDKIPSKMNPSGTAKALDSMGGHAAGALAMGAALLGHNPLIYPVVEHLGRYFSRDAPDAVRLAALKFLGSDKPLEAEGFKAMVDYISKAQRGAKMVDKAATAVFKPGSQAVISEKFVPDQRDRDRLDKAAEHLQQKPESMFDVGGKTSYYLDNHGEAIGGAAATAVGYLNSIRPQKVKQNPLDSEPKVNPFEQAKYNRALDIANQPLVVLQSIKDGNLTPMDVQHLKGMYPSLYNSLSNKLTAKMTDAVEKHETVPYSTRLSLSLFLGYPLDSTMTAQGIMSAQPMQNPNQSQQKASPGPHSYKNIGNLAQSAMTPSQKSEYDSIKM